MTDRRTDSPEFRAALRQEMKLLRAQLATLAHQLETVDHDAARDIETARSALFASWSKLRAAPPAEPVCPLIRQALTS